MSQQKDLDAWAERIKSGKSNKDLIESLTEEQKAILREKTSFLSFGGLSIPDFYISSKSRS